MMINGQQMESTDWISFCTTYIEVIAQVVHRYCNVPTFDPGQPEALITEYRSGRGPTDDWDFPSQYLPSDYQVPISATCTTRAARSTAAPSRGFSSMKMWVGRPIPQSGY